MLQNAHLFLRRPLASSRCLPSYWSGERVHRLSCPAPKLARSKHQFQPLDRPFHMRRIIDPCLRQHLSHRIFLAHSRAWFYMA